MHSRDVDAAIAEAMRVLRPAAHRDWQVPAGSLDWSCHLTAAHVAHVLVKYATQIAGRVQHAYLPFDVTLRGEPSPAAVLDVVAACASVLASACATAGADARAWHWGPTDPGGFAALGVEEILVHTYDITQGLGVDWLPPARLCEGVLRLFPDAPPGDPVQVLLWSTGRVELRGHPRVTDWVARAAVR